MKRSALSNLWIVTIRIEKIAKSTILGASCTKQRFRRNQAWEHPSCASNPQIMCNVRRLILILNSSSFSSCDWLNPGTEHGRRRSPEDPHSTQTQARRHTFTISVDLVIVPFFIVICKDRTNVKACIDADSTLRSKEKLHRSSLLMPTKSLASACVTSQDVESLTEPITILNAA